MSLAKPMVKRLSIYKEYLLELQQGGHEAVYSHELAAPLGLTPAIVRKDFSLLGSLGAINDGYKIVVLLDKINQVLGTNKLRKVVLFGVGNLGRALLGNQESFLQKGFFISKAFDTDAQIAFKVFSGVECFPFVQMEDYVKREKIKIAILAVPKKNVDELVKKLLKLKIKCFLNFTAKRLVLPEDVFCESVDFSRELEKLSYYLNR